jgi:hypothetical protein
MNGEQRPVEQFFPRTLELDGAWVIVTYCFLVVFILLPTFLVTSEVIAVTEVSSGKLTVWLLAGVSAIGFLVGIMARRFTVAEPALATFFFLVTLIFELDWGRTGRHLPLAVHALAEIIMWSVWSIFLAGASSMLGRAVRFFRNRRRRTVFA